MADRELRRRHTPSRQMPEDEPKPEDRLMGGQEQPAVKSGTDSPGPSLLPTTRTTIIFGVTVVVLLLWISDLRRLALEYYHQLFALPDNQCNTPSNRQVWCNGTNINTDYEHIPNTPPGTTRKYYLELENTVICPDGYCVNATLINGTYPGPLLWGYWGDSFEITVKNKLQNCNGSSIHFHGLRQWNTTFADGVAGVTQCPIPPNEMMTYKWNATQYGSSWYHSHFSLQYANGLLGPIVLEGPSSANYDIDAGPLLIGDWYHEDAFSLYYRETELHGGPPPPDSKLINGMGNFTTVSETGIVSRGCEPGTLNCEPVTSIYNTTVQRGKKYKFRIVNTSVTSHLTFSIDGHQLQVISADFVPINPYTVSNLTVAIGQRYEVIVDANAPKSAGDNFWIKLRGCGNICTNGTAQPVLPQGQNYEECRQGILSYSNVEIPARSEPDVVDTACLDQNALGLVPVVPRSIANVTDIPPILTGRNTFKGFKGFQVLREADSDNPTVAHWILNDFTFKINWKDPTLSNILSDDPDPPNYAPVYLNGTADTWRAFVIEGNWTSSAGNNTYAIPAAHPIHLHGHDFLILLQESEPFDPEKEYPLKLDNPARRDVVMLPVDGFIIIAFRLDNPGPWLMHCHIAWHASAGLALQFVERYDDIKTRYIMPSDVVYQFYEQCSAWGRFYDKKCTFQGYVPTQDDSGI
ncbi:hypothetical protein TWF694_010126 [Orbilia ellipsospora]|uniref:Laccase n=1 Tax=Orbilia ellipsospora TaxID=2528407 RepID=A0AAV9X907_9PEZI